MKANHPAIPAMRAALKARPPRLFASDFTHHDVAILARANPLREFAWRLHDNGTHILWLDSPRGGLEDDRRVALTLSGADFPGEWFVWDGFALHRATPEEIEWRLVENYRIRLSTPEVRHG